MTRAAVTLLLLLAAGAGCSSSKPFPAVEVAGGVPLVPAQSRAAAPSFSGESLNGDRISSEDYKGYVMVLNFWASWCAPCRMEAHDLNEIAQESERLNVRFLGVNVQDSRDKAQAFERAFQSKYPSIFDPSGRVTLGFQGQIAGYPPTTLIVDSTGRIAGIINGAIQKETLFNSIRYVSEETPSP